MSRPSQEKGTVRKVKKVHTGEQENQRKAR